MGFGVWGLGLRAVLGAGFTGIERLKIPGSEGLRGLYRGYSGLHGLQRAVWS